MLLFANLLLLLALQIPLGNEPSDQLNQVVSVWIVVGWRFNISVVGHWSFLFVGHVTLIGPPPSGIFGFPWVQLIRFAVHPIVALAD